MTDKKHKPITKDELADGRAILLVLRLLTRPMVWIGLGTTQKPKCSAILARPLPTFRSCWPAKQKDERWTLRR